MLLDSGARLCATAHSLTFPPGDHRTETNSKFRNNGAFSLDHWRAAKATLGATIDEYDAHYCKWPDSVGNGLLGDEVAGAIIGIETVDKMTDRQIAAKVREYFQQASGRS